MAYQGGPLFTDTSDKAIRLVSLIATPIFVIYNLIVMSGAVHSDSYVGILPAMVISMLWLILGVAVYYSSAKNGKAVAFRLALYHVLALATLVFITGFANPFAPAMSVLFLATYVYFGWGALSFSIAAVCTTAAVDAYVRSAAHPGIVLDNILGTVSILTLGAALVSIITAQEIRRRSLVHSQAREKLQYERTMAIINNLNDAALSVDTKGTVLMYNAACLSLLDTNDSLKGAAVGKLFTLTDTDSHTVNLFDILRASTRSQTRDDLIHTYSDGEQIRLEVTSAPIKGSFSRHKKAETNGGYIIIVRDVTKRKSLEEERDEFISVVSHELRTPITIVEGTVSNLALILSKTDTLDKKRVEEMVTTAHDQVLYLAKMVNDLSTLSRAERGVGDSPERIDVAELLQNLHRQYEKEAKAKKLRLTLDLGTKLGHIHTSRLYVEELLQNFITNSLKYTDKGTITIIGKKKRSAIRFTVKDTGIGISRGDQTKIFNKFYRSEDYRIRETSGTGLGLYVSAKLAHKIQTKIELTSRLNHGSSFSFELPTSEDDLSTSPDPGDTAQS
ncbi:PAS domain-containing protein [Candidatus Saccharibacteria bacterium]|nr:PAS domain-containing protein [Candidatus Saccharibacteria bacterium]NCS82968.1 PAS domain-containing protein [Candidatus Saccharibacteria bacterium]